MALAEGAVVNGEIRDPHQVAAALRALWDRYKFSTKSVSLAISNEQVQVRPADLEWFPPADFKKSLKFQAADVLDYPTEEVALDYYAVGDFEREEKTDGTRRMSSVQLVALHNDRLQPFLDAVAAAGLQPVRVDISAYALVRASVGQLRPDATGIEFIVDVGADVVTMIAHHGGRPLFVRIVSNESGSAAVNTALINEFGWNGAEAEHTKVTLGLTTALAPPMPPSGDVSGVFGAAAAADQVHPAVEVIEQQVSRIINTVQTSLDFFLGQSSGVTNVQRVVLSGGGSKMKGFADRLSSQLSAPVQFADPMRLVNTAGGLTLPDGLDSHEFSVVLGLGMGLN